MEKLYDFKFWAEVGWTAFVVGVGAGTAVLTDAPDSAIIGVTAFARAFIGAVAGAIGNAVATE